MPLNRDQRNWFDHSKLKTSRLALGLLGLSLPVLAGCSIDASITTQLASTPGGGVIAPILSEKRESPDFLTGEKIDVSTTGGTYTVQAVFGEPEPGSVTSSPSGYQVEAVFTE